ncbi:MAG TPA: hypothetical protein VFA81_04200, partial [Burkholderiales bacterium]|nr:hypothetical protein [Burkholderiales bacterium]
MREKSPPQVANAIAGSLAAQPKATEVAQRARRDGLSKWLISGPPLFYLLVFFAIPTLIMVLASFRYPGDYGGLAPLFYRDETGLHLDVTLDNYT